MDPKRDDSVRVVAKSRQDEAAAYKFPSAGSLGSFPPVDTHIVVPEITGDERLRGRALQALPALAAHADRQASLAAIVAWAVRDTHVPSVELLTRVSEGSDFATDVCIRKAGEDPETGQRYLEEISFEVINEQSLRDIREKAEELVARGIRRFFAIFVKRGVVAEWSRERGDFVALDGDFVIDDPCFEKPISVRALLDKAEAEREIVLVLEEKKSPGIEALKEKALARGEKRGMRKGREKGVEEGIEVGVLKGREEGLEKGLEKGIQAGLELGRVQGREEGLEKGRVQGREEGLAKGREEGLAKGREEGLRLLGLLVEGRLGRPLSEAEQKTLAERAQREGMERVAGLSAEGLRAWLLEGEGETKAR